MKNYAQHVKEKLMESIKSLESLKDTYVQHANKDFTRTRKLPFDTMIKLTLEMEGSTLGHELRHYFSFALAMPTGVYPEFCVNVLRECKQQKLV